jgi:hypothetical protein
MTTERRTGTELELREGSTRQLLLSTAIRSSTAGIGFPAYSRFLDDVLRGDEGRNGNHEPTSGIGYPALREATDRFVDAHLGVLPDKPRSPCLAELIWSYWQEEGMLVQSLHAMVRRAQNGRIGSDAGPLANLQIDPLRPLAGLLSSYADDDRLRRNAARRAHEYEHHYGLALTRRAPPASQGTAQGSTFSAAFQHLLRQCHRFHERDEQRTVLAEALPVLNALQEVHLLLAPPAHDPSGDLPSVSRAELLIAQWLLARPEMRDFLGLRTLVPYPEGWMDRVDAMKALQGWTDAGVIHFNDLATFGEQILLGIRFGGWNSIADPAAAANFARIWRAEIQGYLHAYRTVTGVDLVGW